MQYTASLSMFFGVLAAAGPLVRRQQAPPADLSQSCADRLTGIGFGSGSAGSNDFGVNAMSSGSGVWIGSDGAYTNTFTNNSGDEVCLVVWGANANYTSSFVTAVQPLITVSLASGGGNIVLSFDDGQSGAFSPVYSNTVLSQYGQIQNTWGEFTMSASGVVDVSQEVFTQGNSMSIVGPDCTSDMTTCVFQCKDSSVTSCGDAGTYVLNNCDNGSQPGAQRSDDGANGGCGWLGATQVSLQTTFS